MKPGSMRRFAFAAIVSLASIAAPSTSDALPKVGEGRPSARAVDADDRAVDIGAITGRPILVVYEDKESLVISAELPGLKREEVEISLDGDILTLRGERKFEKEFEQRKEGDGRKVHRVERSYGSFARSFQLPTNVDAEKAHAQLTDGVLTLRLPKKEVVKGRKIEVKG